MRFENKFVDKPFSISLIDEPNWISKNRSHEPFMVYKFLKGPIRYTFWTTMLAKAPAVGLALIEKHQLKRSSILMLVEGERKMAVYVSGLESEFVRITSVLNGWVMTISYEQLEGLLNEIITPDIMSRRRKNFTF